MGSRLRVAASAIVVIGGTALTLPSSSAAASSMDFCHLCVPLIMCPEQSEGQEYCEQNCGLEWVFEGCNLSSSCEPSTTVSCRFGP